MIWIKREMQMRRNAGWVISLFLILSFWTARAVADNCADEVSTVEGPVIGSAVPEEPACVYKGLPYAEPPVDELRWKPPRPASKDKPLMAWKCIGGRVAA